MVAVWRIANYHRAEAPVTEPITKFGGQPTWLEQPQWPLSAAWDKPMRLLRLETNWTPFYLNLGAAPVAFAFLSIDGREGRLLV